MKGQPEGTDVNAISSEPEAGIHGLKMKRAVVEPESIAHPPSTEPASHSGTATLQKRPGTGIMDRVLRDACKSTGAKSTEFADHILVQVAYGLVWPRPKDNHREQLVKAAAAISEMSPQNATEAMLAVQMIACHDAALNFLRRATGQDQCAEVIDRNVLRAARLMRVFGEQLDAMQRLKGKAGQQRVTVEHVHVNAGGQALVGTVTARGRVGENARKSGNTL